MKRSVEIVNETTGPLAGKEVAWITTEDPNGAQSRTPIEVNEVTPYARLTELAGQRQNLLAHLSSVDDEMALWHDIVERRKARPPTAAAGT